MIVKSADLAAMYQEIAGELDEAYHDVMSSGRLLFGDHLESFEKAFAAYTGAAHCVGVGSGLDALVLGLRAAGVKAGDDVLVPANTSVLTWLAVGNVGARPVGVEPREYTHNIDPDLLDHARTPKTTAVLPVHLYGRPAEMEAIERWAEQQDLRVVVDAAQAHGALIDGKPIGGSGNVVAWSFYPTKNLWASADAGCVTTDDPVLADRIRRLRNHGADPADEVVELGPNSRLDELQAAFLQVRLAHLDDWNRRRRTIARYYLDELADLATVVLPDDDLQQSVWHQFVIRVPDREGLRARLLAAGVQTLVHYPTPPYAQRGFAYLRIPPDRFPISGQLARQVLSLPIGPHLDQAQAEHVVVSLRSALMAPK